MHTDQSETVKEAVEGAQGAEVLAEGAVHDQTRNNDDQKNDQFPAEKPAELRADHRLGEIGDDAGDRTGGADVFTECGCQLEAYGQKDDQEQKHRVLQIAQDLVGLEAVLLIKRNEIEKILDESERAEEAAYDAPEESAEEDKKTQHIVGEAECKTA